MRIMSPEELGRWYFRWYFGKPDGLFIRLRCFLLGHLWERCDDSCCDRARWWCDRCLGVRDSKP